MRFIRSAFVCLAVLLAFLLAACSSNKEARNPGLEEAVSTAVEALDLKLRVVSEAGDRLIAYAYQQPTISPAIRP